MFYHICFGNACNNPSKNVSLFLFLPSFLPYFLPESTLFTTSIYAMNYLKHMILYSALLRKEQSKRELIDHSLDFRAKI